MNDLLSALDDDDRDEETIRPRPPLAVRMRPRSIDELVGQQHLLKPGSPLRQLANQGGSGPSGPSSIVLWGPPGTGKTTIAHVIARVPGHHFVELSALTAGVKDVRRVMDQALTDRDLNGITTVLFLDEIHRFNKAQQDALLNGVENRWVVLIAATTENPSFSVVSPLLSRSIMLTLRPLADDDIKMLLERALVDARGFGGELQIDDDAMEHLVRLAGGDARRALTTLEAAAGVAFAECEDLAGEPAGTGADVGADATGGADGEADADGLGPAGPTPVVLRLTADHAERAMDAAVQRYDRAGDQHYDIISAFIKSVRGSDVDAALHYLARMLEAGEDPRFIARRIMISASEDIGMADPSALPVAVAAAQAVALIGMPEARIILGHAVVHLATAPKSNAAYNAINQALADVRAGHGSSVPDHLRDAHYPGAGALGHGKGYIYSHDAPHSIAKQQYAPDDLLGKDYYRPTANGVERSISERIERIRGIIRGR
ncbi:replication-associated recombination protein A [Paeniglutamicibacter cryotolerans]|uniref:Putative ATPase n=2 Tax=Paeniglutamicibacter cryotolerans TaxID=670079 RepID=A0A839QLM3_9MICC|nr:replication-associated recombination protein A [Paeniglutamicibacter cryotolerans]MBB2997129.1 putative ATPase [Paeniglutamicibacter cryotolerans]